MKKILCLLLMFIYCMPANAFIGGQIRSYEKFEQPLNTNISTNVGGAMVKVVLKEDLPNYFGRADIFGGKIEKGYKMLTFMGLDQNGKIKLRIYDVSIMTNENTMTRYGVNRSYFNLNNSSYSNIQATSYGNFGSAYSTSNGYTNGVITNIPKREANRDVLPPNVIDIEFDYEKNKQLEFSNKIIKIDSVTPTSIRYTIMDATQLPQ